MKCRILLTRKVALLLECLLCSTDLFLVHYEGSVTEEFVLFVRVKRLDQSLRMPGLLVIHESYAEFTLLRKLVI